MLQAEFKLIKEYFNKIDEENLQVSKANVGWHLDHILKVINTVSGNLIKSNPEEYKHKFNKLRLIIFTLGFFPRGKAKSPKRVLPPEIILKESLENQLIDAIANVEGIKEQEKNKFFTHPLFKQLNKVKTLKFLKLHTKHHLKIIKDILK